METNDFAMNEMQEQTASNHETAKKIGLGIGTAALGAGTALGAQAIFNNTKGAIVEEIAEQETPEAEDVLTTDDINSGAEIGSTQQETVVEQPVVEREVEVRYVEVPVEKPVETPTETEPNISFNETEVYVDDEGKYVGAQDKGMFGDKEFSLTDVDGDMEADYLWIDRNKDHHVQETEITEIKGQGVPIGNGGRVEIVQIDTPDEPEPYIGEDVSNIKNDFNHEDENLVAEKDVDFNNHEDTEQFSAEAELSREQLALGGNSDEDHSTFESEYASAESDMAEADTEESSLVNPNFDTSTDDSMDLASGGFDLSHDDTDLGLV